MDNQTITVEITFDPNNCEDVSPEQYDADPDLVSIMGYGIDHYNVIDWKVVPTT
jgi:hypothetical protein